ncbi:cyanobacterial phytochrome A [Brasilonema octagenarum UFV-E1]|uniref:histidine kinase n=1 Tax=Brasilonema sennae CENA114 TaxID=415709 RepID=A0A856MES7_9CYAN|nr:ATP-binding protein [Brasilonema sennae]QDL08639.1 cyanobacterial phytochrome A [Brasilonema sennae CENA114]QDL14994.1 cyanobacterial phytochrome A [Brasilonema octagenarum UFV-E1]
MSENETITPETLDLTNCEREPIHIPGSIQPHGLLFVLQEPDLRIIQISNNTAQLLGREPEELLNTRLHDLLDLQQLDAIEKCLSKDFESVNPLKIVLDQQGKNLIFDGIVHRFDGVLILELEPSKSQENVSFFGFYHLVKGTISKIQAASTTEEMCRVAVQQVQQLTGFDRVMVYQFDAEDAGNVIAEVAKDELTPYLGLRYPASDIPVQAKQLYLLNRLRLIPDSNYQPATLVPPLHPVSQCPTDLSLAVLRSVSALHVEYLHNMGVSASMSISLVKNKQLWGLIACHHTSPKYLSYEVRTACEFIGQVMSLDLVAKQANDDFDFKMNLKSILARFIELIPQHENLLEGLTQSEADLLGIVSAQGVAICWNDDWTRIGQTPEPDELQKLLAWVGTKIDGDNLLYTDALPKIFPQAEKFKQLASGLITLAISKVKHNYILWFRPEVVQTVNWGGNPNKPVEVLQDSSVRVSPRKSFALWQETVQGRSLSWKPCEIEAVLELRGAIVSIVLRKADELAKLNLELERSNTELDAFAYIASHDLKEPLRGIHNYASFLIEDYADILDQDGVEKLQTLLRLTSRMEDLIESLLHFSRLGRMELNLQLTDTNELVQHAIQVIKLSMTSEDVEFRIPRPLPTLKCDRIQLAQVFTNLISNAMKYNSRSEKWIEIGYLDEADTPKNCLQPQNSHDGEIAIIFYVRDNGIGIKKQYLETIFRIFKRLHGKNHYGGGTGAGLTIAKKIVERHNGRIWVESTYGEGSTFYFALARTNQLYEASAEQ